ncbi:MAG: hypothetical protein J6U83_02645, partial [Bacteroidales bacterium]|nr:hypothetical protein [Bacteroidales bacterium]
NATSAVARRKNNFFICVLLVYFYPIKSNIHCFCKVKNNISHIISFVVNNICPSTSVSFFYDELSLSILMVEVVVIYNKRQGCPYLLLDLVFEDYFFAVAFLGAAFFAGASSFSFFSFF